MTEPDYTQFYDLEGYLFGEVSQRFQHDKQLSAFDFFCIVVWKANRSKSKVARRLLAQGHRGLNSAIKAVAQDLDNAADRKGRLAALIEDWGFRLTKAPPPPKSTSSTSRSLGS